MAFHYVIPAQRPGYPTREELESVHTLQDRRHPGFRNMNGNQYVPAVFWVFHVHITDVEPFLIPRPDGQFLLAIVGRTSLSSIIGSDHALTTGEDSNNFFHSGQIELIGNDNWRVAAGDRTGEHSRAVLDCNQDDSDIHRQVMLSGNTSRLNMLPNGANFSALEWWLNDIYEQGYTRYPGIRLMLNQADAQREPNAFNEIVPNGDLRFGNPPQDPPDNMALEQVGMNTPFLIIRPDDHDRRHQVAAVPRPAGYPSVVIRPAPQQNNPPLPAPYTPQWPPARWSPTPTPQPKLGAADAVETGTASLDDARMFANDTLYWLAWNADAK